MSFQRVRVLPAAVAEINAIEDVDVREAAVDALVMVEGNLEFGAPLDVNEATGDLRGARKIYVDKAGDDKPRYRLVYWLSPSSANPRYARVLAFGPREQLGAYETAAQRYNADRASQGLPAVETQTDARLGLDT